MTERIHNWLSDSALPLWLTAGVDSVRGGFYECLSLSGTPQLDPKRMMVQARQIYVCRKALELNLVKPEIAGSAANSGLEFLLKHGARADGSYVHSVECDGRPKSSIPDLYTQAFALFGLGNAQAIQARPELKAHATKLVDYLERVRRSGGGYTELIGGKTAFESNPHMHLFEAAIAWMEIDPDPRWKDFSTGILELCLSKFIDPETGALAEHFNSDWQPQRVSGTFVFEPGHHFEWAWLMGRYSKLTGADLSTVRRRLYDLGNQYGVNTERQAAIDEVWSNLRPKLQTSRFWPQTERIKAAVQFAIDGDAEAFDTARTAMATLFKFLDTAIPGLWYDTWLESGEFRPQPAKASSLYHIVGAMCEYLISRRS